MRIAFVLASNSTAGGIYVAYRQAHHLRDAGHDVTIVFVSAAGGTEVTFYPGFSLKVALLRDLIRASTTFDVVIATWWETFYEMFRLRAEHYLYFVQSDERRFYPSPDAFEVPFVERTYTNRNVG